MLNRLHWSVPWLQRLDRCRLALARWLIACAAATAPPDHRDSQVIFDAYRLVFDAEAPGDTAGAVTGELLRSSEENIQLRLAVADRLFGYAARIAPRGGAESLPIFEAFLMVAHRRPTPPA